MTALGGTLKEARDRAFAGVAVISWPGMQYRSDIARLAADEAAALPTDVKVEAAR